MTFQWSQTTVGASRFRRLAAHRTARLLSATPLLVAGGCRRESWSQDRPKSGSNEDTWEPHVHRHSWTPLYAPDASGDVGLGATLVGVDPFEGQRVASRSCPCFLDILRKWVGVLRACAMQPESFFTPFPGFFGPNEQLSVTFRKVSGNLKMKPIIVG